jgi:hypothetical protein
LANDLLDSAPGGSSVESNIARRLALYELLTTPDPPDLHRGHVQTLEGKPDRHQLVPRLAAAFVQAKLLEMRQDDFNYFPE